MLTAIAHRKNQDKVESEFFSARTQSEIEDQADQWGAQRLEFYGLNMVWRKIEGEWVRLKG